ncbi:Hypothetical predicted protein [Octopus vulgaris]|uniref:Uncharacterized protein n=1 Tax=Octopus vulgaris TaxID=6645 RepID=A0AA36APS5_OCTVU|nr:Hypothetical predicted protein [Octopus vulgaris]
MVLYSLCTHFRVTLNALDLMGLSGNYLDSFQSMPDKYDYKVSLNFGASMYVNIHNMRHSQKEFSVPIFTFAHIRGFVVAVRLLLVIDMKLC